MVELCPFINMEHFSEHPVRYAAGILSLLYLGGCRCVNSYFSSDFSSYSPEILQGYQGFMSREQSIWLNEYTGRLGSMLDQAFNECGIFVYYALEEVQAKTRPSHCAQEASDSPADRSIFEITRRLFDRGYDYLFADMDDIVAAADSIYENQAWISGFSVENIILPGMDVIYPETWEALIRLKEAGVTVWFADKLPKYRVGEKAIFAYYDFREESVLGEFTADGRYFVMSFARCNNNRILFFTINNSICFVDSSAPPPTQIMFEWFRLTNAVIRASLYIFNNSIDSL